MPIECNAIVNFLNWKTLLVAQCNFTPEQFSGNILTIFTFLLLLPFVRKAPGSLVPGDTPRRRLPQPDRTVSKFSFSPSLSFGWFDPSLLKGSPQLVVEYLAGVTIVLVVVFVCVFVFFFVFVFLVVFLLVTLIKCPSWRAPHNWWRHVWPRGNQGDQRGQPCLLKGGRGRGWLRGVQKK